MPVCRVQGLGKTIQAITAMKLHRYRSLRTLSSCSTSDPSAPSSPYLVVCPALLVSHWFHETTKFSCDSGRRNPSGELLIPIKLAEAIKMQNALDKKHAAPQSTSFGQAVPDRTSRALLSAHTALQLCSRSLSSLTSQHLVIVSYTALRTMHRQVIQLAEAIASGRHSHLNLSLPDRHMFSTMFTSCVLDEGHLCRNPKSLTTLAVYAVQATHRLVLTGTPLQNTVEDIWAAMQFVLPDYLGPSTTFQKEMVIPIRQAFVDANCSQLRIVEHDGENDDVDIEAKNAAVSVPVTLETEFGIARSATAAACSISSMTTGGSTSSGLQGESSSTTISSHAGGDIHADKYQEGVGADLNKSAPRSSAAQKRATAQASKAKKQIDISANGLGLLRTLHSQVYFLIYSP